MLEQDMVMMVQVNGILKIFIKIELMLLKKNLIFLLKYLEYFTKNPNKFIKNFEKSIIQNIVIIL